MNLRTLSTPIVSAALAAVLGLGCGKKEAPTDAPPATAATATAEATTAAPPTDTATKPAETPDAGSAEPAPAGGEMSTTAPADVAAAPADATKTASGLAYKNLVAGTGEAPHDYDTVTVHYVGWTTDGKMFDSSVPPAEPISFPLNRVIAGWTEGVQLMKVGDRTRFWIPEALAYQGQPGAPAGMLVFDVQLEKITPGKKPIEAPADVAAPPADAQKTASGLAWKVMTPGKDGPKPTKESTVTVHYTGWTTDGKMFDSSVMRDQPATFPLGQVIPGWTEGLQLMNVGEKSRFWIPVELAYNGRPGRPGGMLVFDVELISFQ